MVQFFTLLHQLMVSTTQAGAEVNGHIVYGGSAIQTFWVCVETGAKFVWDAGVNFS